MGGGVCLSNKKTRYTQGWEMMGERDGGRKEARRHMSRVQRVKSLNRDDGRQWTY